MLDDAVGAVVGLAASQHGAFTRRQAAAVDFDDRRLTSALARGWIDERYPGVYLVAGAPSRWHQLAKAATLAAGGHAVSSHRSAARLHGLDGFATTDIVEVSVTRVHRWRYRDGTIAHHIDALDRADIVVLDGIRCTGLARTLVDLGTVVFDVKAVSRALTDVRRRDVSLRWVQATAERLHRPGQRGSGLLLRSLAAIPCEGRVPDSWFEELLMRCVADKALGTVVRQCPVRRADGRIVARTDIGFPDVKLGLEAHSRRFHFGPDAESLDEQRDLAAAACGWELLYMGWYATKRPADVLSIVKQVVAGRRREV